MKVAPYIGPFAIFLTALISTQGDHIVLASQPGPEEDTARPMVAHMASPKPPVSFAKAVAYGSGGYPADSVAIGDLNGDGHADLVVANYEFSSVGVLLGNGDGTFQTAITYSSGGFLPLSVAIGDVNGDGNPDLIVADGCSTYPSETGCTTNGVVAVLIGNGDGTFQTPISYSSGGDVAISVVIADVNRDGNPDLVVANVCQSTTNCVEGYGPGLVTVLLGNGDGTFQPPAGYSSGGIDATSVAVGYVKGDSKLDLVVTNLCMSLEPDRSCGGAGEGDVAVLRGNGNGTFQNAVSYDSGGSYASSVAIGDVNGDGSPDLIVSNEGCTSCNAGEVSVLLGKGDGAFKPPVSYDSGGGTELGARSVALADVNGDGSLDVAVANYCQSIDSCTTGSVTVLLGNGDGTFQTPVGYSSGGLNATSVATGDINGDGKPDLVVTNECQHIGRSGCAHGGTAGVLLNNLTASLTIKVKSSLNPSKVNESVVFTATITSNPSVPNDEVVTFYDGSIQIGTGTTSNDVASLTTSFPTAGTHTIEASYPGDLYHKAKSGTVKQVEKP